MAPLAGIAWWPLADGAAWTDAWRAHPAVWLAIALAAAAFVVARRRAEASAARSHIRPSPGRPRLFALALVLLWLSIDWPLGTLAAGYLLSAAAAQFLLLALAVAPLLLASWPGRTSGLDGSSSSELQRRVEHPLTGALAFAVVLFATHVPSLVDPLRGHAAGALFVDAAWLGAGLLLWRPVIGRSRTRRFNYLAGIAYLFVPFILPKAPGLVFAIATEPLFEVYADASRVRGFSAAQDMQLAGILLWSAGTVMIFVSLGILYTRWVREDRRMNTPENLGVPADPEVVALLFALPGAWVALEQLIAIVHTELPQSRGARLDFERRPPAHPESAETVAAVLSVALDPEAERDFAGRVDRAFEGYLGRLPADRAASIRALLTFEVAAFSSRVA